MVPRSAWEDSTRRARQSPKPSGAESEGSRLPSFRGRDAKRPLWFEAELEPLLLRGVGQTGVSARHRKQQSTPASAR